ncbi:MULTISPECIES: RNA-binding protein [Bacillaceae]|uniref:YlmH family RNA-binding protein n=1 Tax=Bacillales TaxID=1385 RepID=UPI0018842BCC|nr:MULTISPECIES: RNA-binding protein [Bacillaceae]MBF0708370.1 RNA-binding protein [Pseudalkalibacillus hwajinpoensis]MDO6655560.1 RNA-binding protein [Anaerobacillus sp. 1_MG-2023]
MSIYEHYRPEERTFVDRVLQWQDEVQERYAPRLTDFLDPREQDMVRQIIGNHSDVGVFFSGGVEGSERQRALLVPPYFEPTTEDFEIIAFEITYPAKFVSLTHPDLLGAMMGLGIKREKFGDILVQDSAAHLIVAKEIADFVKMNLTHAGKASISPNEIPLTSVSVVEASWQEQSGTVTSLRLDTVLAEVYNLSRGKVAPMIEHDRAKLNWKIVSQPSAEVKEGDYLSLRGSGRSKIISVDGKTKRDKWRITYQIRK